MPFLEHPPNPRRTGGVASLSRTRAYILLVVYEEHYF